MAPRAARLAITSNPGEGFVVGREVGTVVGTVVAGGGVGGVVGTVVGMVVGTPASTLKFVVVSIPVVIDWASTVYGPGWKSEISKLVENSL